MKNKIKTSTYSKPWGEGANTTYYHNVTFEGVEGLFNIGCKQINPPFLAVGQELEYEITDAEKKKIKKVKVEGAFGGGGKKTFVDNSLGQKIGNSVTNAVSLICAGKVELKDLEGTARRIAEVSTKLQAEFKDKV